VTDRASDKQGNDLATDEWPRKLAETQFETVARLPGSELTTAIAATELAKDATQEDVRQAIRGRDPPITDLPLLLDDARSNGTQTNH
jgi:hypothetical protein